MRSSVQYFFDALSMFDLIFLMMNEFELNIRYFSGMYRGLRLRSVKVSPPEVKNQARKAEPKGSAT